MTTLMELRAVKLEKLNKLKELGINPYPADTARNTTNEDISKSFEELENKQVIVAGRIMSKRGHGKLSFIDVHDESGKIQLYIKEDNLKGNHKNNQLNMEDLDLLDVGDFVEATGNVVKTQRGEISVEVEYLRILSKSLRPIPEKFTEMEERYRKRYLDFIINSESKKIIETRSKIVSEVRNILIEKGFLEVETPTLQPIYGGANAKPFKTYYNALKSDFYLKISDELYLKRLIIGGFEKVFEIDHNFRNEGIDATHNPEFTMMECYWAYADYNQIMELTEEIYSKVAEKVLGTDNESNQG